jgi:photosystem II stability/assembly factor-like uncharacterized protein
MNPAVVASLVLSGSLALATAQQPRAAWIEILAADTITAFAAARQGTLYAARGSTIFRSHDAARTWTAFVSPTSPVTLLAVDPRDPEHVWTLDSPYFILESSDGGVTWTEITAENEFHSRNDFRSLALSSDGTVVYAGGSRFEFLGFCMSSRSFTAGYRSTDDGMSWTIEAIGQIHSAAGCGAPPAEPLDLLAVDAFDPTLVYGVVDGNLIRHSATTGWMAIPTPGCAVTAVITSPAAPGRARPVVRPVTPTSSCSVLLDTVDGGRTFFPVFVPGGPSHLIEGVAFDPANPNASYVALFSTESGLAANVVLATTDDGHSWRDLDWESTIPIRSLAVNPDGRALYAVTDNGVFARELGPTRGEPRTLPFRR